MFIIFCTDVTAYIIAVTVRTHMKNRRPILPYTLWRRIYVTLLSFSCNAKMWKWKYAQRYTPFFYMAVKCFFNFTENQYFENSVLTRTSGPKLEDVTWYSRKKNFIMTSSVICTSSQIFSRRSYQEGRDAQKMLTTINNQIHTHL